MKKKNLMIVGLMGCLCFVGCGAEEAETADTVFSKVEYQHDTVQQETVESVVETEVVETLEELQTNDSNVSKGTVELLQSKPIESEDETEETEEDEDENDVKVQNTDLSYSSADFSLSDIDGTEFTFCNGAGTWQTTVQIYEDGTFEGIYEDCDEENTGDDYPDGTLFLCEFTGSLAEPEQESDYAVSCEIDALDYAQEVDEEEIIDDMLYIYSDAYGLAGADRIMIYMPGTPLEELPEELLGWIGFEDSEEVDGMQLPFYAIYNEEEGYGFQSEAVEDYRSNMNVTEAKTSNSSSTTSTGSNALDEAYGEIAYAESIEASCDNKMQASGNSQAEMARFAADTYDAWDYAINSIWAVLREELSSSEFNILLTEQRAWVDEKKSLMKKAGASCVDKYEKKAAEYTVGYSFTKERVYELVEYLK